ncbi:MAG: hypothetical protein O2955_13505 [Planctomycetota bacterium]|nr:hypothetical protein [Planctomycetota bacterium]MDA1213526.1 hypothetical protein [Planctomycetota bacterium]
MKNHKRLTLTCGCFVLLFAIGAWTRHSASVAEPDTLVSGDDSLAFLTVNTLSDQRERKSVTLIESDDLKWRKGNLHTHTLWSDGDNYLEMVALWYKEHNYQFLGVTDHNTIDQSERWVGIEKNKGGRKAFDNLKAQYPDGWVEERTTDGVPETRLHTFSEVADLHNIDGEFLMIRGEEISDGFQGKPIHMNASNIQEVLPPLGGESIYDTMQNNVNAVIAQRERTRQPIMIHLNHPNFHYAITAEDLMRVRGENFFEVYNGHPSVFNRGDTLHISTEKIWDIINAFRLTQLELPLMYGLGTDDGHNYHNIPSRASEPGRAWVMVLTKSLDPQSIVLAMEAGEFYSSCGVTLDEVSANEQGLTVRVHPEEKVDYRIEFVGTLKGFNTDSQPVMDENGKPVETTRIYSDEIGQVLKAVEGTSATYEFQGNELYVRARVISSKPHPNPSEPGDPEQAWTQPVIGPGL